MIRSFERAMNGESLEFNDLLATAAHITAVSIARAIYDVTECELIVSGGGAHNQAIMGWLCTELGSRATFCSIRKFGISEDTKEAVAFALLGAATLDGVPSNVPGVTGAKHAVVLGSITPKPA